MQWDAVRSGVKENGLDIIVTSRSIGNIRRAEKRAAMRAIQLIARSNAGVEADLEKVVEWIIRDIRGALGENRIQSCCRRQTMLFTRNNGGNNTHWFGGPQFTKCYECIPPFQSMQVTFGVCYKFTMKREGNTWKVSCSRGGDCPTVLDYFLGVMARELFKARF